MKRVSVLAATVAILSAPPASASDFSMLAKPEFARSLLLSEQRKEEIRCTYSWVMTPQRSKLAPLIAEIDRRSSIELGSGEEFVRRDRDADNYPDMAQAAAAERSEEPARCGDLEAAFARGGGAAAIAMLAPASSGPIPLPSTGHCLSQLEKGPMGINDPTVAGDIQQVRARAAGSGNFTAEELGQIDRDYSAHVVRRADPPPPDPAMEVDVADIICFPVVAEFARRVGPPPGER